MTVQVKIALLVKNAIRDAEKPLSIEFLKRILPIKITDQTLRQTLAYLESRDSIMIGRKGIVWIENRDPKFLKLIEKSRKIRM
jgi:hypothetical protein